MTRTKGWLRAAALWVCLAGLPAAVAAQAPPESTSREVVTLLKEQHSRLSGDLRRIQREIAALRAELEKPGIKEIFSGIGYILGLFGVAAFVASRRNR